MTLVDHAEAWARENYIPIPPRDHPLWRIVYELWIAYAFEGW
jgi:hypothetical protein